MWRPGQREVGGGRGARWPWLELVEKAALAAIGVGANQRRLSGWLARVIALSSTQESAEGRERCPRERDARGDRDTAIMRDKFRSGMSSDDLFRHFEGLARDGWGKGYILLAARKAVLLDALFSL